MTATDQRTVAYHEAGHAVIAWFLGCQLVKVTIDPDDEAAGRIVPEDGSEPNGFDEREELGMSFVSFPEALMVEEPDGTYRPATAAEREFVRVVDDPLWTSSINDGWRLAATAGEAAQYLATGKPLDPETIQESEVRGDRHFFREAASGPDVSWEVWSDSVRTGLSEQLVWRCVEAVAAELLERLTVPGEEIRIMLRALVFPNEDEQ